MQPTAAVDEFLSSHEYAPRSRDWYGRMLAVFIAHLEAEDVGDLARVTAPVVRGFLDVVRARENPQKHRPVSTHTVHGYARAVRTFLRWCAEEGLLDAAVPRRVKPPKLEKRTVIEAFTPEQVARLLRAAERTDYPLRNRALLAVLVDTGIRAQEACTLTLPNVHFDREDSWLYVHGKGNKWRAVGLGEKSRSLLHRYVHRERGVAIATWPNVFLGKRGPLTRSGLDQLLYMLRGKAGEEHFRGVRVSAHTFRHTYAQTYLANGGEIFKLSRLLGHASVSTTEVYLRSFSSKAARQGPSVFDNF